eukprot:scaffold3194_cov191-Alexandrium_tamarense.AAC.1
MLKKEGKTLVILSNSSKRREDTEKMLVKREFAWLLTLMPFSFNTQLTTKHHSVGFNPTDFDNIITSGDVSHSLLQNQATSLGCSNWDMLSNIIKNNKDQRKVFVFGSGDNDKSYCNSA